MISLYFHIPFCEKKCNYCSFYIIPTSWLKLDFIKNTKDLYLESLKNEVDYQLNKWKISKKVYTIYFWWWTPSEFWLGRIFSLLKYLKTRFDFSDLQEFSFELNPVLGWINNVLYTLEFMDYLNNFVQDNFSIPARFSIWIQSLNDEILKLSNRNYTFYQIEELLDNLQNKQKSLNPFINLDFISFGLETYKDKKYFDKFKKFVWKYESIVDSYSVYTLELFDWSVWKNKFSDIDLENEIFENFSSYVKILQEYWYLRYEISNFAKQDKYSKHNLVYWTMKPYLWFGSSASWFVFNSSNNPIRYTNSYGINEYLKWKISYKEFIRLSEDDLIKESIFLWLRTSNWIILNKKNENFLNLDKLEQYVKDWYLLKNWDKLCFTDNGFWLYNYIITDILDL